MKTGKETRVRITSPVTVKLSKPAVEKETRKITVSLVLSWIFGVFFGLGGLVYLKGPFGVAISYLLISAILLPPVNKFVKEKFDIELSRGLKIAIVVILFFIAGANMPAPSVTGSSVQSEMKQNAQGVTGVPTTVPTETVKTTSPTTYKFGDKVVVGNFAYTFLDKTVQSRVIAPLMGIKEADGTFVIFDLEIENVGKEPEYLWSPPVKIIDGQGRKYEYIAEVALYLSELYPQDKLFMFGNKLQPGLPSRTKLAFDVPTEVSQDSNTRIELSKEGLFSSEKKYILTGES